MAALGLVPLALRPAGDWDPDEAYWSREGRPLPEWAASRPVRSPRSSFVMEQIIPGADPEGVDLDPTTEAIDLKDADAGGDAEALLMSLLGKDLRCLDAHAHLGNWEFTFRPQKALRHYAVGVGIGELALGAGFEGVLPWSQLDNRPFLRCLNGAALANWCLGNLEQAAALFRRELWLDPADHQDARQCLALIEEGRSWKECAEAGG